MSAIQWTPELLAAASAIIALLVGSLTTALIKNRKQTQLETQLELANSSNQTLLEAKTELEKRSYQLQLSNSQLEQRLENVTINSQKTEQRLTAEAEENKHKIKEFNERLEQTRERHNQAEIALKASLTAASSLEKRQQELLHNLQQVQDKLDAERAESKLVSAELTELKTTLEQREQHFKEQMAQLSDTKQSLGKEFENLANKIFEEKGKTFSHTSQASIDALLKPFREQIDGFQKRVNEVHDSSLKGSTNLAAEIKKVLDVGLQMSQDATNLTSALKGDSQQRGAWGEAQLERTLEMSGLTKDTHYDVQSNFKDEQGNRKQTDYLIKLPDNKNIIIDSKVSLVAYDRAVSAETPEEYKLALNEHSKAVRRHIDDLASKDYTSLAGMHSPSFVLMFMPIEPAYIEVLKHEKDLFDYGYKKGIVLVSHTTLIPILRTVSNLWMMERSNTEAREISEKAGEIYNQVCLMAERLDKLGGSLTTASGHYNRAVTALVGQQGLYGKVERFNQLSTRVNKTLPAIEPAHMDFQTERLALVAEPITEPEKNIELNADKEEAKNSTSDTE